ncbi:MAG TPA: VWA domain-containing protein [Ruminococcus flavefaciens]|nr:VWA domain-containing protein [Ruminococcus flavefaciens]HQL99149.1 VWA domain-containing protein [Ruminococcus flavefaciens]
MKRNRKLLAVSSACMIMAASLSSCGDNMHDIASGSYKEESSAYEYDEESADEEYAPEYYSTDDYAPEGDYYYWEEEPELPSANEEYKGYTEAGFKDTKSEPLSTFSADVDTASYTNVRRLIENRNIVPEDAVRIEEFINYFDYDYSQPEDGSAFGRYVEIADCPWNQDHKLMMVGIQGKELEQQETPPSNLVFLIDSSGSMSSYDKLPLVQSAFSMLAEQLDKNDRISIVTYAGSSAVLLDGEKGSNTDEILEQLYSITASGSTNGEGGINTAYELAEKHFIKGGNNRVILATDGDLNVGASSEEELTRLIETKRDNGIYLSVLGFGEGNYKDARMEALADNGNGNFSYIDSEDEAERVLVQEMSGTLYTIAKDVKIQVEFNPSQVSSYRLIGYDNRLMNAEDFLDDTKDAGEVGSGHSVTALYEIEMADTGDSYHGVPLEFASEHDSIPAENNGRSEICKLFIAYKTPVGNENRNTSDLYSMDNYSSSPSKSMMLAQAAAGFGMVLRNSDYKGDADFDTVLDILDQLKVNDNDKINELYGLILDAADMY